MAILNYWNAALGLLMMTAGVITFIILTKRRINGDQGGYGNHTQIYTAAVGSIIAGTIILIKEVMKL